MSVFRFKQFEIKQDKCAMKIGTDGVLLGAWANISQASSILDIGTGTGLLTLMAAQRNLKASIYAIEIEQQAYKQASENINNSNWNKRLTIVHQSIQSYVKKPHIPQYDSIISNPPYFEIETNYSIKNKARRQARSTDGLSFKTLLDCAFNLLKPSGNFSVILPTQEGYSFIALAVKKNFYVKQLIDVIPRVGKNANRLLIELVKKPTNCKENTLIIRSSGKGNHDYTSDFEALHKDFLLFL